MAYKIFTPHKDALSVYLVCADQNSGGLVAMSCSGFGLFTNETLLPLTLQRVTHNNPNMYWIWQHVL